MKKWALVALVLVVYGLHQDSWNWTNKELVLGVLPVGLAYHAFYSCLAATMMFVLVRLAWPAKLEAEIEALGDKAIRVEEH